MISLFLFEFSYAGFATILFVAMLIGMSKTGVHGAGMLAVPLLASVFGGLRSSGIMLPMLCLADIMGVWYYHRHASWSHLKKLFPWAIVGTLLGTWIGGMIDDASFKMVMAIVILISVAVMIWLERDHQNDVPDIPAFAAFAGIAGGFTSMVGNLAGSVMAVYFLSMRLPKREFIGTTAWFFMVINWMKIPFHVFAWKSITWESFLLDLTMIPLIIAGGVIGILVVGKMKDQTYRWFIIAMTIVAAIVMLT